MANKLFKVNVEIDVYVMADGLKGAAQLAKLHAGQEVAEFSKAHASEVGSAYEIPEDWKNTMPYSKDAQEKRTCSVIMKATQDHPKAPQAPLKEVETPVAEVDAPQEDLPVELPKNNDLPKLRFKI